MNAIFFLPMYDLGISSFGGPESWLFKLFNELSG